MCDLKMNCDEYVRHISQKYAVAVAIAVINTKPENKTTEQHIEDIKLNINNETMITDDLDITVCSEDFNFNDNNETEMINESNDKNNNDRVKVDDCELSQDSVTVLKDFDDYIENNGNNDKSSNELCEVLHVLEDIDNTSHIVQSKYNYYNGILTQPEIYESSQISQYTDIDETFCESIACTQERYEQHIYNNVPVNEEKQINKPLNVNTQNRKDIIQENRCKALDSQCTGIYTLHGFTENLDSNCRCKNIVKDTKVDESNNFDSQATEIYTVHGFTQNKQSIDESDKLAHTSNKRNNITLETQATNMYTLNELNIPTHLNLKANPRLINKDNITTDLEATELYTVHGFTETDNCKTRNTQANINIRRSTNNFKFDSQATELYSVHGFTDNYTHVSQSQNNNVVITEKFIKGNEISNINFNINNNRTQTDENIKLHSQDNLIDANVVNDPNRKKIDNETVLTENTQIINENTIKTFKDNATAFNMSLPLNNEISLESDKDLEEDMLEELTTSQAELVPFKVIEELNKIKLYLNKFGENRMSNDGSVDSAYKSDSQTRSHRSALQSSSLSMSQSAHCLYEYIMRCPLVATTNEITTEISRVLGQLIDRLHVEEACPSFLEELLEHIEAMLNGLYTDDQVLLKKEENIHRLSLFNKSVHIVKYSIEKITKTLEKIHTNFTQEDLYELNDIIQTENIPYMFHILEILIKRYLKSRDTFEDISQKSQDISLRRSDISEIWRRRWNIGCKDRKIEGSQGKSCVLTKCGEVLNKIVVDCMNGYSLVAFSALQCFNLLQS